MAIVMDRLDVGANESIYLRIQGSIERGVMVEVSKSGRCFVTAPVMNSNRISYELTIEGMREVTQEERTEEVIR